MSTGYDSVIIMGEDVHLLVLLTGLKNDYDSIFFRKPGRTQEQLYSPNWLGSRYNNRVKDIFCFFILSVVAT